MRTRDRKGLRNPSERVGTLSHAALPPPPVADSPEHNEQAIIDSLRRGDEEVFETLLDRWYSPMLRVARSYVRSEAVAEEVVQETWMAVLRGIDNFQGRSSLKTWIFRIVANRARTLARREARTRPLSEFAAPAIVGAGFENGVDVDWLLRPEFTGPVAWHGRPLGALDPHEQLVGEEMQERIEAAIRRLPTRQQEVITLRDLEGWTSQEVCEALDVTEGNQRVLLHRARMKVRDSVREAA